jgi:hypothetical protein
MRVSEIRFFRDHSLERSDRRFEFVFVDVVLRFVQQIIERVGKFLRFGAWGLFGGGLCARDELITKMGRNILRPYKD